MLLLKELELSPEDVTMIGDNFQSDYEIPKSSLPKQFIENMKTHTLSQEIEN